MPDNPKPHMTMSEEKQPSYPKQFLEDHKLQAPVGPVFKFPTRQAEEAARLLEAQSRQTQAIGEANDLPELQVIAESNDAGKKANGVIRTLSVVTMLSAGAFTSVYFIQAEKKDAGNSMAQASLSATANQNAGLPPEVLAAQAALTTDVSTLYPSAPVQPVPPAASGASPIETLFMAKDYAALIAATKNHPCDAKEQNMLGIAYYNLGQFEQAAQAFKKLEEVMPADPIVKSNLADALLANNQGDAALEKYRQAQALNPADTSYKRRIAQLERQVFVQANEKKARGKSVSNSPPTEDFTPRHIAPIAAEAYTFTDLRNAVERSDMSMVESILAQGFDINKRDGSGQTLLISAINNNDLNMARFLILKGANPNLPGYDGYLPLMRAKANRPPNAELIRYLQSAGAIEQYAKH